MEGWIILCISEVHPLSNLRIKMIVDGDKIFEESNIVYEVFSGNRLLFTSHNYNKNKVFFFILIVLLVLLVGFGLMFFRMYASQ